MSSHRTDAHTLFAAVVIELATLAAITILAALRVLPGEAVLGFLGTLVGARAMRSLGGPGGGAGGTGTSSRSSAPPPQLPGPGTAAPPARVRLADVSIVAALALLLFGWLIPHHAHSEI